MYSIKFNPSNHISQVNFLVYKLSQASCMVYWYATVQSRRCRDKEDVARIQEYLSAQCQDPFDVAEVPAGFTAAEIIPEPSKWVANPTSSDTVKILTRPITRINAGGNEPIWSLVELEHQSLGSSVTLNADYIESRSF